MARKKNYLNNKDLLVQIELSKQQGKMTEELGKMLIMLTKRYARRPQFSGYSYLEDMEGYAIMMIVRYWDRFDATKSSNPFAYFSQCIHASFLHILKQEKKQQVIRDEKLLDQGKDPSHTFTSAHEAQQEEKRQQWMRD